MDTRPCGTDASKRNWVYSKLIRDSRDISSPLPHRRSDIHEPAYGDGADNEPDRDEGMLPDLPCRWATGRRLIERCCDEKIARLALARYCGAWCPNMPPLVHHSPSFSCSSERSMVSPHASVLSGKWTRISSSMSRLIFVDIAACASCRVDRHAVIAI